MINRTIFQDRRDFKPQNLYLAVDLREMVNVDGGTTFMRLNKL